MRAVSFESCYKLHNNLHYQSHGLGCGPAGNSSVHILIMSMHSNKMTSGEITILLVLNVKMVVCSPPPHPKKSVIEIVVIQQCLLYETGNRKQNYYTGMSI